MNQMLLSTTALRAVAYASQPVVANDDPRGRKEADWFEKRDPDSAAMLPCWDKVDAIMDGIQGMRDQTTDFLPKFRDEDGEDYKFRLQCTKMTNVYRDIVEGLSAKPFEQQVQLIEDESPVPQQIKDFAWDVDGSGNNLTVFAAHTFFKGVNNSLDWIMVDHEKRDPTVRSIADAKARNLRPYWSHVLARNVLRVESRIEGSKEVLTYVKILEPGDPQHIREFERTDTTDANGRRVTEVVWRLWRKVVSENGGKREYELVDSGDVSIGVIPLVPFVTGRRDGRRWRFDPPMSAAAELQIDLYQQESALKFASLLTGYPMLAANGISPPLGQDGKPNTRLAVGPNRVLWSQPNMEGGSPGSWSYVEPGSESLKFLGSQIDATIQQLRELGRQPLTASSSNITVITAAVAAGKAKSAVKAWAYKLKDTLENALLLTALWMGIEYDPTVHVFAEFDDWMEGEDIDALLTMREKGDISAQTLYEEMQRRGVLSSNFTTDRERMRLLEDTPVEGPDITEE